MKSRLFVTTMLGIIAGLSDSSQSRRELIMVEDGGPVPNKKNPTKNDLDRLEAARIKRDRKRAARANQSRS